MAKQICEILMERDGVSEDEANYLVANATGDILDALDIGDFDLVEDIMMSDLGLELDYILDIF